ncbi:DUF3987 domain-containing protein [Eubacteriales bacterium OttesenSCG-928-A19]|nr:DUF3987 domain-containing protein [Eubacteriales bacterium OttesenSCG-928-A19]
MNNYRKEVAEVEQLFKSDPLAQAIGEGTVHIAKALPPAAEEWTQPVPFNDVALPPFPAHCLPDTVCRYVRAVSEAVQVSVDMTAVSALSVASLCVQKKYRIQGKPDWSEPLNIFACVTAPPAERKSAVSEKMTRPILSYERQENERLQYDRDMRESQRNIVSREIKILEEKAAKGTANVTDVAAKRNELSTLDEIKPVRLWTDDATPEAVVSLMVDNGGRTAVISAEGGLFEIMAGRYSNSINIDVYLKAHAGDAIRVDRKGRPSEYVNRPAMAMLLFIQPVVLEGLMQNDAFRGRGLLARFLYALPVSRVGRRAFETVPIPEETEKAFHAMLHGLLDIPMPEQEHVIRLSSEAYALSAGFADVLEPRLIDDLEAISDWAGKLHGAVLRVAGILHTMEHGRDAAAHEVSGRVMQNAILIGGYFLEHAKAAYSLMGADARVQDAKYILRQISKNQQNTIARRTLLRLCRRFKTVEAMDGGLSLLVEHDYIRPTQQDYSGTGRKPDTLYKVKPQVYVTNVTDVTEPSGEVIL